MSIDANEATILNESSPEAEKIGLGTEVKSIQDNVTTLQSHEDNSMVVVKKAITADATGGLAVTIPEAFELVDVIVQARATSGGGTVQVLRDASAAITDAITMAVDNAVTRAGTIDDSKAAIATTDAITVKTNGGSDRGLVTLVGIRS